jgi:large subunit ribosomal protein L22
MSYRYSTATDKEELVKAVAFNRPISHKQGIEIANALRKKPIAAVRRILDDAISMRRAIPYKRFTGDTGHKKSIGPGRYPVKSCKEIRAVIDSLEAAAIQKGLDSSSLIISHISCQQGTRQLHYGRMRSRLMKRTHIEVVAEAKKAPKKPKKEAKKEPEKKQPAKAESKVDKEPAKVAEPEAQAAQKERSKDIRPAKKQPSQAGPEKKAVEKPEEEAEPKQEKTPVQQSEPEQAKQSKPVPEKKPQSKQDKQEAKQ